MIIQKKSCQLGNLYKAVKRRVGKLLPEYMGELFFFDDSQQKITFKTETLTPTSNPSKPNVLLLFSNPHPGSVTTGMFLCTTPRTPHRFWWSMREAGWFKIEDIDIVPKILRDIFISGKHGGPFNLFFDCFYDFPTKDPKHLKKIFGSDYFISAIQPNAMNHLAETIRKNRIDAIVSFNGEVTSIMTGQNTKGYTTKLNKGQVLKYTFDNIPVYQTYPTGFRFRKDISEKRRANLSMVKKYILSKYGGVKPKSVGQADITEPSVIFKIQSLFRPDLSEIELYDITRGYWKIADRREQAKLAFCVVANEILEVYQIIKWFPAGTTFSTHPHEPRSNRWEFIGNIASKEFRDKYLGKSVHHYFPPGAKGPFRYLNI